jgi:hypothetical protein
MAKMSGWEKMWETKKQRAERLRKADEKKDIKAKKAKTIREEREADVAEKKVMDWMAKSGNFEYNPQESETLDIYNRQARQQADAERINQARLAAKSGLASSGALGRTSMRIAQGQQAQMSQNTLNDIAQQYRQFQDDYARGYQQQMTGYGFADAARQRAQDAYQQQLAVNQQNAMLRMQQDAAKWQKGMDVVGLGFKLPGVLADLKDLFKKPGPG